MIFTNKNIIYCVFIDFTSTSCAVLQVPPDYNHKKINLEMVNLSDVNFLRIEYADKKGIFLVPGETFNIKITTQQNAYIYCYVEDQNGDIVRFFSNRLTNKAFILMQNSGCLNYNL